MWQIGGEVAGARGSVKTLEALKNSANVENSSTQHGMGRYSINIARTEWC
jgi:hypothetical protein